GAQGYTPAAGRTQGCARRACSFLAVWVAGIQTRSRAAEDGRVRDVGVLIAVVALLATPVHAGDAARLELSEPHETVHGPAGWVQVAGRISSGMRAPCDLMIALDMSESAFLPSGVDVDGDGVVGVLSSRGIVRSDGSHRPTRAWTTDPDDTVFELS